MRDDYETSDTEIAGRLRCSRQRVENLAHKAIRAIWRSQVNPAFRVQREKAVTELRRVAT